MFSGQFIATYIIWFKEIYHLIPLSLLLRFWKLSNQCPLINLLAQMVITQSLVKYFGQSCTKYCYPKFGTCLSRVKCLEFGKWHQSVWFWRRDWTHRIQSYISYRPISLLNAECKLVAKVLARRLQVVLSKSVKADQSGFVKRWYGADNMHRSCGLYPKI